MQENFHKRSGDVTCALKPALSRPHDCFHRADDQRRQRIGHHSQTLMDLTAV
jgi:hypothetical protein